MARCSISLLGTIQFTLDGSPLRDLESAKVRLLLAYLAVESAQVHERERLAGLFWPEMSEAQARHSLSQALYNLKQSLGEAGKTGDLSGGPGTAAPFLLLTTQSVQFNPQGDTWLDVRAFEQALASVRRHAHRRLETCAHCARLLHDTEHLYQGDFLPGASLRGCQAFEEWALVRRERLHLQICAALSDLVTYHEGRAETRQALEASQRWVHLDPFNEPAQRSLLRTLALNGQRTQALANYTSFARTLQTELAVEPSRETQQLYQRILAEETSQTSLPGMPGRLPVPLTPFVGREDELAELAACLRDRQTRLLTLLGPGGSGKTRLALEAARLLRYNFPDSIFLVSLSGLGSSAAFLPALASTLSLAFQPSWGDPFEQLLGYLQHRHLLLILDSFEEVLDAAPDLTRLLQSAPGLQILVTSRARLNVQAEQIFPLEGLHYPDPTSLDAAELNPDDYSALQLFHNAAHQVRPDYSPTQADLPALARICRLVAGMPLGLVLAAGWLATCSPAEIAAEIERSLDFLSSTWSDLPERQRSLRATLDYSWQLLTAYERQAFQKLSVFHGAFTRPVAAQVAGVNVAGLRLLVDKSMLQASAGSYRVHDLLRQYGSQKLAEDPEVHAVVRTAHSEYYLQRLAGQESRLMSAQRSAALDEIDSEANDMQAAWNWACAQANISLLARSLSSLCLYYEMRMRYREGEQACQAALSMPPAGPQQASDAAVLRSRLLLCQANFLVLSGDVEAAIPLRQAAGARLDQLEAQGLDVRRPRARYWHAEGDAQPELKIKLECYQRASALYQDLGEDWHQAGLLVWVGEFAMRLGNPTLAAASQQEALRLARQAGEPGLLLHSLRQSTYLNFFLNQTETARQLMQEMAAFSESIAELSLRANAQMHLGVQLLWCGRYVESASVLERAIPLLRGLGYRYGVSYGTSVLGTACMMSGAYARGEEILKSGLPEAERGNFLREAAIMLVSLGLGVLAQGHPLPALEYFSQGAQRYRAMQFSGELSMALGGLALGQHAADQAESATATLVEALRPLAQTPNMAAMFTCLPAMVYLLARLGHQQTALLAHRLTMRLPIHQHAQWYADLIGAELTAVWDALPPDQQTTLDASARQHTPFSLIPQVLSLLANQS